jgi:hypothetical protein
VKWPKYLEQKEVLFSPKTPKEELIRWGDRFLNAKRLHDAVAFYAQAGYQDGLQKIRQLASEEGDVCLFREALNGMDTTSADPNEWAQLAERAETRGRWHDAQEAYEQIKDSRGLQRVKEAIGRIMAGTER